MFAKRTLMQRGQAMLESVLAVLIISTIFFGMWALSRMLTGKMLAEHAAMRVARARAVGFNNFICIKTARVAVIPVAGKRIWPTGDELDWGMELSRVAIYMQAKTGGVASGVLDYEGWGKLNVHPGDGTDSKVTLEVDGVDFTGNAGIENNCRFYLNGL